MFELKNQDASTSVFEGWGILFPLVKGPTTTLFKKRFKISAETFEVWPTKAKIRAWVFERAKIDLKLCISLNG